MPLMRRLLLALLVPTAAALVLAAPAAAKLPVLKPASYPGMTTFNCRTDAITLQPGQNLNKFTLTKACPHAEAVRGPLDESVFEAGSDAEGYLTRFKPSMVEIKRGGKLVTPAVWDLHLHHVVWLPAGGGTLAAGEEKTIAMLPQGYGRKLEATADWGLLHMLHNLTARPDRRVYLTWQIDWVPETEPARTDISQIRGEFMGVANGGAYPVFDAERSFDEDGDGKFTFPEDVSTDPSDPSYEEAGKISGGRLWTVPSAYPDGVTLLTAGGHLHPGGLHVDLKVARDGPDPGAVDGDDPVEVKRLFRSEARYYEPAGAVSWDVAMTVTRRGWRVHLEPGDTVFIDATYDVRKASWYESMGILSLGWTPNADPKAKDPFENPAEVRAMFRKGGALTHRRLPENVDTHARKNLRLPDPRKLRGAAAPAGGVDISSFVYEAGGFSAVRDFPAGAMRPPVIRPGGTLTFTNEDALFGQPEDEQVWHTITACRAPCNKGSGIGYPLANGPVEFDSGQLGYGTGPLNGNVTIGSDSYTTPPLRDRSKRRRGGDIKRGTTYTYFCRLHPFMRGSFRVRRPLDRG